MVSRFNRPSFTPLRWLVTGGAGFIGCNLVSHLQARRAALIRVLDNLSVGSRSALSRVCTHREVPASSDLSEPGPDRDGNGAPVVELVVGDIRESGTCIRSARGVDVIVHLAASTGVGPSVENPRMDMETNVIGTLNMLEAARLNGVGRFVFASSGAPVGECDPPIHEEMAPHPVSPYGASKLAGEGYCSAYYRSFQLGTVCLRFGNVYGPLSTHKSSIVAKFIRQALAGQICEIYGDGNQSRDFIYVDDLVNAILKAVEQISSNPDAAAETRPVAGETFQIATSREHTINEVADILRRQLPAAAGREIVIRKTHPRVGDVQRNFSDTSKALRLLYWQAKVQLDEGLRRTIDFFIKQGTVR